MVEDHLRRNQGPMGTGRHMRIRQNQRDNAKPFSRKKAARLEAVVKEQVQHGLIERAYEDLQDKADYVTPIRGESLFFMVDKHGRRMNLPELRQNRVPWNNPKLIDKLRLIKGSRWTPCRQCQKDMPVLQEYSMSQVGRISLAWWVLCLNEKCRHQWKVPDSETRKIKITVSVQQR